MDILNKSVIVATHYLVYGAPQAFREYFINKKGENLLYISHPLFTYNSVSFSESITKGDVIKKSTFPMRTPISFLNYLIEVFITFYIVLTAKQKYEVFIGIDALNAFAGILLKKFGTVEKVIFYTIDYVPNRFNNSMLNKIYHWLDKFCVKNSDETWNVSPRISEGREKYNNMSKTIYNNQRVVPIGIWFDRVKRLPFSKIKKHKLFFIGHLMESAGVDMVLDAVPEIVKSIPDFEFLIVGGGEHEENLRQKASDLKIEKYVTFTGWIKDRNKLDNIMEDSAVAVALYDKKTSKTTAFSDPTKLKDYLSAGLPIILTDLPHNAHDIEKHKCGIIVDYNKDEISNAICKLMTNTTLLKTYRTNALTYAQKYDWNVIFNKYISN